MNRLRHLATLLLVTAFAVFQLLATAPLFHPDCESLGVLASRLTSARLRPSTPEGTATRSTDDCPVCMVSGLAAILSPGLAVFAPTAHVAAPPPAGPTAAPRPSPAKASAAALLPPSSPPVPILAAPARRRFHAVTRRELQEGSLNLLRIGILVTLGWRARPARAARPLSGQSSRRPSASPAARRSREALARNPGLLASKEQVEQARAQVVIDTAFPDPTLAADVAGQSKRAQSGFGELERHRLRRDLSVPRQDPAAGRGRQGGLQAAEFTLDPAPPVRSPRRRPRPTTPSWWPSATATT